MTRQPLVARHAEELLGSSVVATAPVAGGDVCVATKLRLSDGTTALIKTLNNAPPGFFAAEARGLTWLAETGADPARLNPNGGAIALGHPLGGSGTRLMTTMLNHMRAYKIRYGLQTMCEGGGQANATILELL